MIYHHAFSFFVALRAEEKNTVSFIRKSQEFIYFRMLFERVVFCCYQNVDWFLVLCIQNGRMELWDLDLVQIKLAREFRAGHLACVYRNVKNALDDIIIYSHFLKWYVVNWGSWSLAGSPLGVCDWKRKICFIKLLDKINLLVFEFSISSPYFIFSFIFSTGLFWMHIISMDFKTKIWLIDVE